MYCISCQVSSQHFSHNSILSLDIMLVSYVDKVGLGRNDHLEGKTEIPGESCLLVQIFVIFTGNFIGTVLVLYCMVFSFR